MSSLWIFVFLITCVNGENLSENITNNQQSIVERIDHNLSVSIDYNVDPCDDFFEFSCRKWIEKHPLGPKDLEISTFSIVSDMINDQILSLLNGTAKFVKPPNIGIIKAIKQYKACMNLSTIEELKVYPLITHLKKLQIPSFNDNLQLEQWDVIQSIINYTKKHTITPLFFDIDVNHDHFNSSRMIVRLDEGSMGLTKELIISDKKALNLYKDFIESALTLIKPYMDNDFDIKNVTNGIIEFEIKLAHVSTDEFNKSRSNSLRRTTINELRAAVTTVDWLEFIRMIFSNDTFIDGDLTIITISPNYLYEISNLLLKSSKRDVANYMLWRIIQSKLSQLGCKYRKLHNIYTKQLNDGSSTKFSPLKEVIKENCSNVENDEAPQTRDEFCSNSVNAQFGIALASAYIDKYLTDYQLNQAKKLIIEVILALEQRIKRHQWIDVLTRIKILDKMDSLHRKVGFPSYIYNESYIESRFGDKMLTINENSFLKNVDQMDLLFRYLSLKKLTEPIWSEKWGMYPQTLNAMYQFFNNEIVIPAGILRQPFFYASSNDNGIPMSLSFGALGSIVGHELTHAIDSTGRKFDKKGNAVKEWWEGESLIEFNEKAVCFLEQYSNYIIYNQTIDGKKTLAENIADNGGINIAYEAYLNYLSKISSKNLTLSHKPFSKSNFTNNQLFFISYAQQYCVNNQEKYAQIGMINESHAPSKLRVIGSLSNMKQFSEAFNCKNKAKMNPINKCTLW